MKVKTIDLKHRKGTLIAKMDDLHCHFCLFWAQHSFVHFAVGARSNKLRRVSRNLISEIDGSESLIHYTLQFANDTLHNRKVYNQ